MTIPNLLFDPQPLAHFGGPFLFKRARNAQKAAYIKNMKRDPTDLMSEHRANAEIETRRKLARDNEDSDFKWLMSSKRGRRIVWRQLDAAGVFRSSFNTNAMTMAFSEGNKNYGLKLLADIHRICPELYPTMVKEANEQRNIDDGNSHNDQ